MVILGNILLYCVDGNAGPILQFFPVFTGGMVIPGHHTFVNIGVRLDNYQQTKLLMIESVFA